VEFVGKFQKSSFWMFFYSLMEEKSKMQKEGKRKLSRHNNDGLPPQPPFSLTPTHLLSPASMSPATTYHVERASPHPPTRARARARSYSPSAQPPRNHVLYLFLALPHPHRHPSNDSFFTSHARSSTSTHNDAGARSGRGLCKSCGTMQPDPKKPGTRKNVGQPILKVPRATRDSHHVFTFLEKGIIFPHSSSSRLVSPSSPPPQDELRFGSVSGGESEGAHAGQTYWRHLQCVTPWGCTRLLQLTHIACGSAWFQQPLRIASKVRNYWFSKFALMKFHLSHLPPAPFSPPPSSTWVASSARATSPSSSARAKSRTSRASPSWTAPRSSRRALTVGGGGRGYTAAKNLNNSLL
jgi:hypothetical protein